MAARCSLSGRLQGGIPRRYQRHAKTTRTAAAHVIRELPKPLPPPPTDATLFKVLPYLSNLAFSEPGTGLRLFGALGALLIAKAAGPLFELVKLSN